VERQVKNTPHLTENSDDVLADRIIEAFHLMRNVHLFVLILSIPQELARRQGLREKKDKTLVKVSSYMPEKADTPWKLVRQVVNDKAKTNKTWHTATDNLAGTV
jgi:hypothetical protein